METSTEWFFLGLFFQLKDMAERLPPGSYDPDTLKLPQLPNGLEPNGFHAPDAMEEIPLRADVTNGSNLAIFTGVDSVRTNGPQGPLQSPRESYMLSENSYQQNQGAAVSNMKENQQNGMLSSASGGFQRFSSGISDASDGRHSTASLEGQNFRLQSPVPIGNNKEVEAEWIEQYEPGVYITLVALRDGTRDLKRVRFR